MKRFKMLSALALGCLLAGSLGMLAGCGQDKGPETDPDEPVLNFVAVDGTNWDADVTIEQKTFKLSLDLNADNTLSLAGTCTGKAQSSGGGPGGGFPGGGFPGGGFPGGGFPGGGTDQPEEEEPEEPEITDYSVFNFEMDGTWTEEKGFGYVLTMDDKDDTVIHVNFDTTSGRHYFNYYIAPTLDGEQADEALVRMEARDSAYRKTLDANYKIYEERTCTYMFRGGQEGGSGNLSSAWVYLMPDGSLVSISGTSNSLTYNGKGSWSEDKTAHVITMDINGTAYKTNAYCDTPGREGYRMEYSVSSFGGSSSMNLYASCDVSKYTWDLYTDADFEGANILTLTSADYSLLLTEKGYANIVDAATGKTKSFAGSYTTDENGNYVITTQYGTYTSVKEGSTVTMEVHFPTKTGFGPFVQTVETVVIFTATV